MHSRAEELKEEERPYRDTLDNNTENNKGRDRGGCGDIIGKERGAKN